MLRGPTQTDKKAELKVLFVLLALLLFHYKEPYCNQN